MQLVLVCINFCRLSLSGVESRIPVDEVIEAMDKVGRGLPGIKRNRTWWFSRTPTGEAIKRKIFGEAKLIAFHNIIEIRSHS